MTQAVSSVVAYSSGEAQHSTATQHVRIARYGTISPHPVIPGLPNFDGYRSLLKVEKRKDLILRTQSLISELRRTIRRQQLREMIPLADSTIYEMEQRGEFPQRFALSARCVVWDLAEVEAWLQQRRTTPIRRAQHPDVAKRKTRPVKGRDRVP
ncbi:putative DNA-binding transcriptional regulator AlpA [Novosphingobium sp. SG751A]|nr:putative DNA-binding transcriptional regulator AlpA [Novosphingobium sp. SG751A]